MTSDKMSALQGNHLRVFLHANILSFGTAGVKAASRWQIYRAWYLTGGGDSLGLEFFVRFGDDRDRGNQHSGVRMPRLLEKSGCRS